MAVPIGVPFLMQPAPAPAWPQNNTVFLKRFDSIKKHTIVKVDEHLNVDTTMTPARAQKILPYFRIFKSDMRRARLPYLLDVTYEAVSKSHGDLKSQMESVYAQACQIVQSPSRLVPDQPVALMQPKRYRLLLNALKFVLSVQEDRIYGGAELSVIQDFYFDLNYLPDMPRMWDMYPSHPAYGFITTWTMQQAIDETVLSFWWKLHVIELLNIQLVVNRADPNVLAATRQAVQTASRHVINAIMLHVEEEDASSIHTGQIRRVFYCPSCRIMGFSCGWDIVHHLFLDPYWSSAHEVDIGISARSLRLFLAVMKRIQIT